MIETLFTQQMINAIPFSLIGIFINLLIHTTTRDISSSKTKPITFSWRYLFLDNWKRLTLSVLIIYVSLRFSPELFLVNLNEFTGLLVGLGLDKITEIIKIKTKNFIKIK